MLKTILLVLLTETLVTFSQILFKKGINSIETRSLHGLKSAFKLLKDILSKPYVWSGMGLTVVSIVTWILALSSADLSIVSPMSSIQYVFTLFAAHIFLDEKINWLKFAGTMLVVFGITLITMS